MEIDFHALLENLSQQRPIFYSEKDFQYEVGWEMRNHGVKKICMERTVKLGEESARVDIFAEGIAVELKYPRAELEVSYNSEDFTLTGDRNVIKGFYRFWEDVWRIERLIKQNEIKIGYATLLSNRHEYWNPAHHKVNNYWLEDFVTQEGRTFKGDAYSKT